MPTFIAPASRDLDAVAVADRALHARGVAEATTPGAGARHHRARADHGVVAEVTAGQTITPPPSHTLSPIVIGAPDSQPSRRGPASIGCVAVSSWT